MLAWLARALTGAAPISRRFIRQRYAFASLNWAERFVRALAAIRAIELTGIRKRPRPPLRNAAMCGFRRRIARGGMMRAIAGSRLRKALKHRDPAERLRGLVAALSDIDAFTRRYLVARARRRLTRVHAVIAYAPSAEMLIVLAQPAPCVADTS